MLTTGKLGHAALTGLDEEDHVKGGTRVTGRAQVSRMKARGLPGRGKSLPKRLRVGNAWECLRKAQWVGLAGG